MVAVGSCLSGGDVIEPSACLNLREIAAFSKLTGSRLTVKPRYDEAEQAIHQLIAMGGIRQIEEKMAQALVACACAPPWGILLLYWARLGDHVEARSKLRDGDRLSTGARPVQVYIGQLAKKPPATIVPVRCRSRVFGGHRDLRFVDSHRGGCLALVTNICDTCQCGQSLQFESQDYVTVPLPARNYQPTDRINEIEPERRWRLPFGAIDCGVGATRAPIPTAPERPQLTYALKLSPLEDGGLSSLQPIRLAQTVSAALPTRAYIDRGGNDGEWQAFDLLGRWRYWPGTTAIAMGLT